MLHTVFVKEQDNFHRGVSTTVYVQYTEVRSYRALICLSSSGMLLLGPGLLSTAGTRHKRQRKMLNPVFSASHMRNLTPMFHEIAGKVCRAPG